MEAPRPHLARFTEKAEGALGAPLIPQRGYRQSLVCAQLDSKTADVVGRDGRAPATVAYPPNSDRLLRCREMSRWAMYGRCPRCKSKSDFLRSVRVQPCIRPIFAWRISSVAMQPRWLLALM